MNKPTEHKTVQARILAYSEAKGAGIGQWQAVLFHLILLSGLRLDCAVNPQEEAQKATCATKSGFCGAISHFAPL